MSLGSFFEVCPSPPATVKVSGASMRGVGFGQLGGRNPQPGWIYRPPVLLCTPCKSRCVWRPRGRVSESKNEPTGACQPWVPWGPSLARDGQFRNGAKDASRTSKTRSWGRASAGTPSPRAGGYWATWGGHGALRSPVPPSKDVVAVTHDVTDDPILGDAKLPTLDPSAGA